MITTAPGPFGSPVRRAVFTALLMSAMASAIFVSSSLGILATFLIDDLGVNRTQIGSLIAVVIVLAAVASPPAGRVTDAVGGKAAIQAVFAGSVIGFLGLAVSPGFWVMLVPVILSALGQATGNPSTNKLIALHIPPGRRGLVTGFKQSGVPAGIFFGGLFLPSAALAFGWRWALVLAAAVPLMSMPIAGWLIPNRRPDRAAEVPRASGRLSPSIRALTVYGALLGFGGAYTYLVPLFTEESIGLSERAGGLAVAVIGLTAVLGRIWWARRSDRSGDYFRLLGLIAILSLVAAATMMAATWVGPWALWIGAVLTGWTSSSWNSVGMLAVIAEAGVERAGRSSGVVMMGFLAGLGGAPPLLGWSVDATGSYTPMWLISLGALAGGVLVSARWLVRASGPGSGAVVPASDAEGRG